MNNKFDFSFALNNVEKAKESKSKERVKEITKPKSIVIIKWWDESIEFESITKAAEYLQCSERTLYRKAQACEECLNNPLDGYTVVIYGEKR